MIRSLLESRLNDIIERRYRQVSRSVTRSSLVLLHSVGEPHPCMSRPFSPPLKDRSHRTRPSTFRTPLTGRGGDCTGSWSVPETGVDTPVSTSGRRVRVYGTQKLLPTQTSDRTKITVQKTPFSFSFRVGDDNYSTICSVVRRRLITRKGEDTEVDECVWIGEGRGSV